jgi:hypothetical protein
MRNDPFLRLHVNSPRSCLIYQPLFFLLSLTPLPHPQAIQWILVAVSLVFVVLRGFARSATYPPKKLHQARANDITIITAWIAFALTAILDTYMACHGGRLNLGLGLVEDIPLAGPTDAVYLLKVCLD